MPLPVPEHVTDSGHCKCCDMRKYILKIIAIQLSIILLYLGMTSYEFVVSREINPIGVGLQQWALIILHLLITIFVGLYRIHKSKDKKISKKKLLVNLLVIVIIILIYFCFSDIIWHWLWSFRKDVIQ
jgi:cation transport ATPase